MALVPLAIVFFGIRWVDRWEPEPRLAVVFAFLWGAASRSRSRSSSAPRSRSCTRSAAAGDTFLYDVFGSVVQAPLVEEGGKGLGLLILFWAARKHFDGPVDGIVYAAWVAGGFAFTENILYFGSQLLDSGGFDFDVFMVFLIRGHHVARSRTSCSPRASASRSASPRGAASARSARSGSSSSA